MNKRDELLLLTALSGELPADWVEQLVDSKTYGAALITRLKKEGDISLKRKDGICGYRLRGRAKKEMLERYRDDTAPYLTGNVCTNHVKSEPEKRMRLHRMSMSWIYCYKSGILIFQSEKPELFTENGGLAPFSVPCYYGTPEWKLETDKEIQGSRACGLLCSDQFYILYNTMDSLMKWTPKIERNLRFRMELRMRRSRNIRLGGAIMMGNTMEMVERLLSSDGGLKGTLFRLDDVYDAVYYIPFRKEASIQLRLLCEREKLEKLGRFLSSTLISSKENPFIVEAGKDESGVSVYFCFLLELWQLRRIQNQLFGRGRIFCFTYQAECMRKLFPEPYSIEAIRPEKAARYLGWEGL